MAVVKRYKVGGHQRDCRRNAMDQVNIPRSLGGGVFFFSPTEVTFPTEVMVMFSVLAIWIVFHFFPPLCI